MLAKCSVFIATSLDGFISRNDGSIDWLMKPNSLAQPGKIVAILTYFDSLGYLTKYPNDNLQA